MIFENLDENIYFIHSYFQIIFKDEYIKRAQKLL